jgi:hypothetical protein
MGILPFVIARGLPGRAEKKVVSDELPEAGLTLSAGRGAASNRLRPRFRDRLLLSTGSPLLWKVLSPCSHPIWMGIFPLGEGGVPGTVPGWEVFLLGA